MTLFGCPLCGSMPVATIVDWQGQIACKCGLKLDTYGRTLDEMAAQWNIRVVGGRSIDPRFGHQVLTPSPGPPVGDE